MDPLIIVLLVVLAVVVLFGLLVLVQRARRKGSLKVTDARPGATEGEQT